MHTLLPFTHRVWPLQKPDDPPAGGDTLPGGADPPDGEGDKKLTHTQAELDALIKDRVRRANASAETRLLAELGVADLAAAKLKLKAVQDAEDSKADDLTKAQRLAASEKERADKAVADKTVAEARVLELALRAALDKEALKQGVDDGELSSLWREFRDSKEMRDKVEANETGDEFTGLEGVVKDITKAHPLWLRTEGSGRRTLDTNATRRGKVTEPSSEELVRRKRRNNIYSGL